MNNDDVLARLKEIANGNGNGIRNRVTDRVGEPSPTPAQPSNHRRVGRQASVPQEEDVVGRGKVSPKRVPISSRPTLSEVEQHLDNSGRVKQSYTNGLGITYVNQGCEINHGCIWDDPFPQMCIGARCGFYKQFRTERKKEIE